MMRPDAPVATRGGRSDASGDSRSSTMPLAGHIASPGLLDGNDVILAARPPLSAWLARKRIWPRGFAKLAGARGYRVVEVRLAPNVLSLRCVAGAVARDTIVVGGDKADIAAFAGFRTIVLERGEELAAGVLCLGERQVLADIRYRTALAQMRRAASPSNRSTYEFTKLGVAPSMLALALKRE